MHNPILSAKQFATIDMISEGRFTLGVGVGGREEDYNAIGSTWSDRRWATLSDRVKTMQSVWSKEGGSLRRQAVASNAVRPIERTER